MTVFSSDKNYSKHRFFVDQTLSVSQCIEVDEKLSHYIINVLRLKTGYRVILFNNSDSEFIAEVVVFGKKKVRLCIEQDLPAKYRESSLSLFLCMSLIRPDRFDWAVQKSTELGVHGIYPIISKYTQIKTRTEKLQKRVEHWQAISISACEQSGRINVPNIFPTSSLLEFLEKESQNHIIALCPSFEKGLLHSELSLLSNYQENSSKRKIICLIGPEGGWADEEIELFKQYKVFLLSLGNRVLRSETAALASITLMQSFIGDLK